MTDRSPSAPNERVVLERYRLIERLGAGATAEVWRAHDERLDREVAVKLLHPHLLPDAQSRARLQSEAHAAARLSHPGIVAVYDVDAHGDVPAIVLELVMGESLAARLERVERLPEREAAAIAVQIAEALHHAHERGLVHRDVKPGNIVLTTDGRARLVDFGIARSLQEGAARVTATGTIVGTPRYLAPEQLLGADASPASDVYALGAVLYEMLAGRPPHDSWSPLALVEAHRSAPPALTGVSPRLAAVTLNALNADPTLRLGNAAAVAAELRASLDGGGSGTESLQAVPPAAPLPGATSEAATTVTPVPAGGGAGVVGSGDVTQVSDPIVAPSAAADTRRRRPAAVPLLVGLAVAAVGLVLMLALIAPALDGTDAGGVIPATATASPSASASATPFRELETPGPTEKDRKERPDRDDRGGGRDGGNGNDGNGNDRDD